MRSVRLVLLVVSLAGCGDFRIAPAPVAAPLTVQPASADTGPLGTLRISVTGGRPPYAATLKAAGSGPLARVEPSSDAAFRYQAGSSGNALDVVELCDASACATVDVRVGPPLTVTPESAHLAFGGALTLQISGGVLPYSAEAQHGAFDGFTYTAPAADDELRADQLLVTDATGTSRTVVVTLVNPLEGLAFDARPGETLLLDQLVTSRGAGLAPYTFAWDPEGNSSGGTLAYATWTAGQNADTVDRVRVFDAAGQVGTVSLHVGSPEFLLQDRMLIPGDFDGNGWSDLVAFARGLEPRTAFIASSLRSAPRLVRDEPSTDKLVPGKRPTAIDVNGDGAQELVGIVQDSIQSLLTVWGGGPGGPLSVLQSIRLTGVEPSEPVAIDATGDRRAEVVAIFNHAENPRTGQLCPPANVLIYRRSGTSLVFSQCVPTALPSMSSLRLFAGRFDTTLPNETIGFFAAPSDEDAWFGFLDYDVDSQSFSFPTRPVRTSAIPSFSTLVGAGDFDDDRVDEVVMLTREQQPRALLIKALCLAPDLCELRADQPVHTLSLAGLATRPAAFIGTLPGHAELLVGAAGASELRAFRFRDGAWEQQSRTLPLRSRLPVDFDIVTEDLDTDDRNDLIVAGSNVSIFFGDGRGGISPGDRWRVPGAEVMAGFPGTRRALAAGSNLQVLGGAHGQLYFSDKAPLSGALLHNGRAPPTTDGGEVLLLTDDGLVRASLTEEAGDPRLATRRGTQPDLGGMSVIRRGLGDFPVLATEVVASSAQADFRARSLRLDEGGMVAVPDFVAQAGTVRHTPMLLGDFGARDGIPDLRVTPWTGTTDPLIFYPGALVGGQLTFATTPQPVVQLPATGALTYLDAQWIALERGADVPQRLVVLAVDRAQVADGDSTVIVHVAGPVPTSTRLASRHSDTVMLVGRLDDDPFTDLVLVNDTSDAAFLYGDGQGGFSVGCRAVGFSPRDGWLVDTDGDGRDDLAVYDPALESVFLVRHRERITEPCR